nr:MAG TPA: hypothetical protein [Caudoviricetes sp.]
MSNKNQEVEKVTMDELERWDDEIVETEETEMNDKVSVVAKIKAAAEKHPKIAKAAKVAGVAVLGVVAGALGYKKLTNKDYVDVDFIDAPVDDSEDHGETSTEESNDTTVDQN